MGDLKAKKVDAILVDAICAIAARFSSHPNLTKPGDDSTDTENPKKGQTHRSQYGRAFAKRAMSRLTESFSCPSIAAVQTCLLLAYEQFGSDHDSGLWMWLGISIRLAQDLGLQKSDCLRHESPPGPTPSFPMIGTVDKLGEQSKADATRTCHTRTNQDEPKMSAEAVLQKRRNDTFWAVFFLDRVVSSGTGRPVTLRDNDMEISFPPANELDPMTRWPAPFPALIRIIHLYGRITDLLNSIQQVNHVTPDTLQRLASIENDLTGSPYHCC